MKKLFLIFMVLTYSLSCAVFAQTKRDFFTMTKGDSLAIFLIKPPSSNEKFNVYRMEIGVDKEFKLLTDNKPVRAIIDPAEAKAALDYDYEFLKKATKVESDFELVRVIRSDGFRGGLLSLISANAAKVAGRWFLDENVRQGKTYDYKLVFTNSSGVKTDSITKRVTAKTVVPQPPKNLVLEAGNKSVKVKWEYPAWKGDYGDLGFRYNVFRKKGNGSFEKVNKDVIVRDDASSPDYEDLWLEEGQKYFYFVTISDPVGNESKPSETAEIFLIDKAPPAIVKGLNATDYEKGIVLSWNMNLELDAAGYKVYRSLGLDKEQIEITSELVPVSSPYFMDSTASARTNYFYLVAAVDTAGNIGEKSNPIAGYKSDKIPPSPPTNLSYKIFNDMIKLKWTGSSDGDVKGYIIYRGKGEKIIARINENLVASNAYVDSGYKNVGFAYGGKFTYQISAVDSSRNESEKATIIIYAPDKEAPLAPNNFRAKNHDGLYVEIKSSRSASHDADEYSVYKSEPGKEKRLLTKTNEAPFSFRDTAAVKGKTYIYSVVVADTSGNKSEPVADTLFFKDSVPPPAPRNPIAKLIDGKVELKWGKSIDFDMVGYNVYRSDNPAGQYTKLNDKPVTETKYSDLSGGAKNFYRIRAVDTSGNESKYHKSVSVVK